MKILHTADWQIGKHFKNIPGDAGAVLRQQRFEVVKQIAELANQHQVDAVLVAGDVFDSNKVSDETLRRTINAMEAYQGPWVLLPGNHDAARTQSVWSRLDNLAIVAENHLLALQPVPIKLAGDRLWILPAPMQRRHETRDLTAWFDAIESPPETLRVGLAHGSVSNRLPEKADSMNPIADTRAETARLDYLALGDWHGTLNIAQRTWYAGTPEQDRFKDNNPGHVLLVELEPGAEPQVHTLATGRFAWTKLAVSIEGQPSVDVLKSRLLALDNPLDTLLDLRLAGMIDLEGRYQLQVLLEEINARFHYLRVDEAELKSEPSAEDIATMGATGFVAESVRRLKVIQDGDDEAAAAHATRALQILYFEQRQQARSA